MHRPPAKRVRARSGATSQTGIVFGVKVTANRAAVGEWEDWRELVAADVHDVRAPIDERAAELGGGGGVVPSRRVPASIDAPARRGAGPSHAVAYPGAMSPRSIGLSAELSEYVLAHTSSPTEVQTKLIARTAELGKAAGMQISPEQGELLTTLTELVDPTLVVEVGTFTGYSALAIARGLGPAGRLMCCDVSDEWTKIGREAWAAAGVGDKIDLRLGPALDTLRALPAEVSIDLAFVDADKAEYVDYYEELLVRLAPRGLIAVDNTLWGGTVVDIDDTLASTEAIRRFNAHVADDERTRQVIVPIGDGLTLIRRI